MWRRDMFRRAPSCRTADERRDQDHARVQADAAARRAADRERRSRAGCWSRPSACSRPTAIAAVILKRCDGRPRSTQMADDSGHSLSTRRATASLRTYRPAADARRQAAAGRRTMRRQRRSAAPRPLGLLAELTHRCPLACPYCSNPLELEARARPSSTPRPGRACCGKPPRSACCRCICRAASLARGAISTRSRGPRTMPASTPT